MAYITTNAVVLRTFSLGETDRLMTFLSREYGLLKAVAKGAAKSKKRFGGMLLTGSHVTIRVFIKKKTTLHRLESADLVEPYSALNNDPALFAAASHLLELTAGFAGEQQGDPRQFTLLTSTLRALARKGLDERLLRIFELRTLAYAGLAPNFTDCADCCEPVAADKSACFSVKDGSIRCATCDAMSGLVRLAPATRKLMQEVVTIQAKLLPTLVFRPTDLATAKRTIPPFCEYTLGRKLRSLRMLKKLQK
jgi:DNA repair protein RecO (recombination protein O)